MNTYEQRISSEIERLKSKNPTRKAKLKVIAELERLLAFAQGKR